MYHVACMCETTCTYDHTRDVGDQLGPGHHTIGKGLLVYLSDINTDLKQKCNGGMHNIEETLVLRTGVFMVCNIFLYRNPYEHAVRSITRKLLSSPKKSCISIASSLGSIGKSLATVWQDKPLVI